MRGRIRNPKPEGRKKAEARNPKRLLAHPETRHFRAQEQADYGAQRYIALVAARRQIVSDFGLRPSFGHRVSVFGFVRLMLPEM